MIADIFTQMGHLDVCVRLGRLRYDRLHGRSEFDHWTPSFDPPSHTSQVANAGIAAVKELRHQTGSDLKRMMDVNVSAWRASLYCAFCLPQMLTLLPLQVHGVMNCYIHSANAMIKAGIKGRIIGAASIVAFK